MKPRTVRRLCLVDGMNLDHIEGWLESMAARGLHYDHSDAFLFHFLRGEPAAVRYRLEPRGTLDCPEGMEHCRTLGWELTGYMGKGFSLFRTWEPDAPELHTDPVVRGYGLDKLARLVRWFATPMLICALVILALPLWLLLAWDEPVLSLVTGSGDNLFLCILSEWIAIYMSFRSFSSFFALRRRLRAGKEPRRSGWRCSARINAACLAGSFILVALSFAVLAAGRGMRWEGETATSWPALSSGPASRLSRAAAGSGREAIFWLPLRGTNTFSLCQEGRDQPCWPCISSCFPACAGPWAGRLSCLRPRRPFSGSSRHAGPAASPRGISVSREAGPSFIRGASGTLNSRGSAPYSPSGETSPSETG